MHVSTLLKFNALCNLFFGLMLLLIPTLMMAMFGVNLDASGVYLARMAGAAYLGYAAVTWLSRELAEEQLRPAILPALLTWFTVGMLASLYGQLAGITNLLGWFTVLLSAFFVAGYAYFLIRPSKRGQTRPATG